MINKFNASQKRKIEAAWERGFHDNQIAEFIGVPHHQIFHYRKSLGISTDSITENRLDTWIRWIEMGVRLETIAKIYKMKPRSIKLALWQKRDFSFREIYKNLLEEAKLAKAHSQESILNDKEPFMW